MSGDAFGHSCIATGTLWTLQGRNFDGLEDYIVGVTSPVLVSTNAITIEAWMKFSAGGDGVYRKIVSVGSELNGAALQLFKPNDSGSIIAGVWGIAGMNARKAGLNDNNFHHIVGVFHHGLTSTLYSDSDLVGTDNTAWTLTTDVIKIGMNPSSGGYWSGYIGEVRIYNRALSSLEIQRNYLATRWRYC